MTSTDFTTTLLVDRSPKAVYDAINQVEGWWQGKVTGRSTSVNDEFTYQMEEFHTSTQRVIELIPEKKIVWLVTDSKLSFVENKSEWTGTKIIFEIAEAGNKTRIRFTHEGLVPRIECYKDCSNGWSGLIQESLLSFITTGKGTKVF